MPAPRPGEFIGGFVHGSVAHYEPYFGRHFGHPYIMNLLIAAAQTIAGISPSSLSSIRHIWLARSM